MKTPKAFFLSLAASCFAFISSMHAQQWGDYTLYSVQNSTAAYLIDTNNTTFHSWTGLTGSTGYSCYLLPGGTLLRTVTTTNSTFTGGGMTGRVQKVDYSGTLLWDFTYSTSSYCAHHDICPMPNGNVLLISYELKTASQVTAAGCSSAITMWPDKIVEVQPTGATTGTIVWEWHLWDHLCQSYSSSQSNYVTNTADHPELYDVNYSPQKEIWHMNGIDYNPILDQVVVSAHNTNEIYVIDHSTTTAEAASHAGGRSGKGGDFLYRWGKPATYGQTGTTNFNVVHDAHWIPEGCPNAGYLVGLNNKGISSTISCVDQVSPPNTGYTYSYTPNTAFSPATYTQRLTCTGGTTNMGNSQQMPNGNQLVCLALSGTIYEVDPGGNTIWTKNVTGTVPQASRYTACYVSNAAPAIPTITQNGTDLISSAATTYQWYLDGVQIAGATSQNYTPAVSGTYLVRITDANGCVYMYSAIFDYSLTTGVNEEKQLLDLNVYPNPAKDVVHIKLNLPENENYTAFIYDAAGKQVMETKNASLLDVSSLDNGIYFICIETETKGRITRKISINR
jgi:hypothetical protein